MDTSNAVIFTCFKDEPAAVGGALLLFRLPPGQALAECGGHPLPPEGGADGGDWAPRTRKRHQQEHRPQRLTERSDPTQHAKGRTGDRPGPRKGATTGRNVTQGGGGGGGGLAQRQKKVCVLKMGSSIVFASPQRDIFRCVWDRNGGPGKRRNLRQNRGGQNQGRRHGSSAA